MMVGGLAPTDVASGALLDPLSYRSPTSNDGLVEPDHLHREIRLAVVMYGGVSLAIYINGVAQELLGLVRSTARTAADPLATSSLLHPSADLRGAEPVYRQIATLLSGG